MVDKVVARFIIQMVGKPKDHFSSTFEKYLQKIKESFKVLNIKQEEVKEMEGGLYSAFAEAEIEFTGADTFFGFCLDYMPTSVEMLEPDELVFPASTVSDLCNDILSHLQRTDMIAKTLTQQNKNLDRNNLQLIFNFIASLLKTGPKTPEELQEHIGYPLEAILKFLKQLEDQQRVVKKGDAYSL